MTASPETLTERVTVWVNTARRAVDLRANATRPRVQRQRRARPADPSAPSLEESRETQSLKRVFRDLGVSYRRYRGQTGGPVAIGLRDAAYSFQADPTLASLVTVARFLDELKLLD